MCNAAPSYISTREVTFLASYIMFGTAPRSSPQLNDCFVQNFCTLRYEYAFYTQHLSFVQDICHMQKWSADKLRCLKRLFGKQQMSLTAEPHVWTTHTTQRQANAENTCFCAFQTWYLKCDFFFYQEMLSRFFIFNVYLQSSF